MTQKLCILELAEIVSEVTALAALRPQRFEQGLDFRLVVIANCSRPFLRQWRCPAHSDRRPVLDHARPLFPVLSAV